MVLYKDSLLHSRSYGSSRNEHRRTAFLWQDRMLDEPKGTNFHANTVISKACCLPVKMTSKTVIRSVAWTPWWQTICPTGHWKPKYRKTTGDKLDPDLDLIDTLCDWQGVTHDRGCPQFSICKWSLTIVLCVNMQIMKCVLIWANEFHDILLFRTFYIANCSYL